MAWYSGARPKRTHKIFETSVCPDDMTLKRHMLPTKTEVLKCRLANTVHGKLNICEANKVVIEQIQNIYECAAIPTITYRGMEKIINTYFDIYKSFTKLNEKQCKLESNLKKIAKFEEDGKKLMDFSSNISKCLPKDKEFLHDMRSSRSMAMGGLDVRARRNAILAKEKESADQCDFLINFLGTN